MSAEDETPLLAVYKKVGEDEKLTANNEKNAIDPFDGKYTKTILLTIMLLTNVLGPLSTEAQVPALETIAEDLNTTASLVQLTITIYMLSFGASQLFFGTLSDMYGRRKTLLVGLTIYVLTNIGCALSPNIIALNVFRFVQAMGSGAGMVIVYAIARDVFKQDQRTRILAILGGLRPIIIASSPVFGGAVSAYLGWRYIFWIIGGLSLGLLIMVFFLLPETRDPLTIQITTFNDYRVMIRRLVKNRIFVGLVLISGGVYAGVFIMFNEFSFVMQDRYGISEFNTGLLCGGVVFGLMLGSLVSFVFVKYINPIKVIGTGIIQLFLCGCLLALPLILYSSSYPSFTGLDIWWTLIPLFIYVMADGIMLPHLVSTALEPFKKEAGTASALAGFWRFFSAAVIALIVSSSFSFHLMTLHLGTAAMAFISVGIYIFTLYGQDSSEFTNTHDSNNNNNNNNYNSQHDQVENLINKGINISVNNEESDDEYRAYSSQEYESEDHTSHEISPLFNKKT